jgi:hypothetical protein
MVPNVATDGMRQRAFDLGDGVFGPQEGYLSSVTSRGTTESHRAETWLHGWKSVPECGALGSPGTSLENPSERNPPVPPRTEYRIGSPRLAASGLRNDASKGSRQIRSATSGEGLALRVGSGGSPSGTCRALPRRRVRWQRRAPRPAEFAGEGGVIARFPRTRGAVLRAKDDRFRTGTDRENPTV